MIMAFGFAMVRPDMNRRAFLAVLAEASLTTAMIYTMIIVVIEIGMIRPIAASS
ncbi:MAG: hypothetical protein R3E68_19685 [Burkholderiaceae bacterium]